MTKQSPNENVKGQQPAVSPSLESAARHDGVKAPEQGLLATGETAPVPADSAMKDAGAEEILHRNAQTDAERKK